ncbi:KfrA protein, partial [Cupriavidus sp. CuC1]
QTATLAGRLAAAERAQRRAERAGAEAALTRQLLAELRVALRERTGARRKAGGQGPIANEEPGATALPLNPHDGNDGNGN